MSFDTPLLLYAAPVVALALGLLAGLARRRRIRAATLWSEALGLLARSRARFGVALMGAIGLLTAVGVAGPRWGSVDTGIESRALNVVLAVDISRSMLAEDVAPNRLGRAVREARRLLEEARGDRVALLAFSGRSYILTPLTLDDGAVRLQLDALDPDIASEGGTDLASVLRQGVELLGAASEGGARALVLFTDGEAHDSLGGILEAAQALRRAGATLIVVGEGGVAPVRIPIRDERGALLEYKVDAQGAQVFTERRDDVLRALADAGQGVLVPADLPDQAGAAWKTLAGLDRATTRGRRTEDQIPRAWIFALAAGLLLGAQAAVRRNGALVALAGIAVLAGRAEAQRPATGDVDLARRDSARALAAYLAAANRRGPGADTALYNAGTVALEEGRADVARKALEVASGSLDPLVRFRALYNLGLAALRASRSDTARRTEHEAEAAQRFREALLLDPESFAAKWNLELVTPKRPPPSGGGSAPQKGGGGGGQSQPQPPTEPGAMSPLEAEQILASVERTERAVRIEQLKRRRVVRSAADKDW